MRLQGAQRVAAERLFVAVVLAACPAMCLPHGGGLDAYGCHNDRKAGGYHCHDGVFDGEAFPSKEDMLARLKSAPTRQAVGTAAPLPLASGGVNSPLSPDVARCARINDPVARLGCYDKLFPPK